MRRSKKKKRTAYSLEDKEYHKEYFLKLDQAIFSSTEKDILEAYKKYSKYFLGSEELESNKKLQKNGYAGREIGDDGMSAFSSQKIDKKFWKEFQNKQFKTFRVTTRKIKGKDRTTYGIKLKGLKHDKLTEEVLFKIVLDAYQKNDLDPKFIVHYNKDPTMDSNTTHTSIISTKVYLETRVMENSCMPEDGPSFFFYVDSIPQMEKVCNTYARLLSAYNNSF